MAGALRLPALQKDYGELCVGWVSEAHPPVPE